MSFFPGIQHAHVLIRKVLILGVWNRNEKETEEGVGLGQLNLDRLTIKLFPKKNKLRQSMSVSLRYDGRMPACGSAPTGTNLEGRIHSALALSCRLEVLQSELFKNFVPFVFFLLFLRSLSV